MQLRPYQKKMIDDARGAIMRNQRICIQAPTGSGKTVVFTEITGSLLKNNYKTWIMVPRNELLEQSSNHLHDAGIPHGRIAAGMHESSAFNVHVVSKDTLIRRYDRIKNPPDFLIADECHIALDRQKEISEKFPNMKWIGFSATPERLDGRGLYELYGELVTGPSLHDLVELGFLSEPVYYAPPLEGLDKVHRIGTEVKADELAELFEQRKIYGEVIRHYRDRADGKPTIVFTRDVKSAENTAHKFREAGYKFESIDGKMTKKQRELLLGGLRSGKLQGLVSCELLTYGVDVKNVECIIMLRPTSSVALFFQMVGRGLRVMIGKNKCIILDHVNNLEMHRHPLAMREWNFYGTKKRKTQPDQTLKYRLCPETFLYCTKAACTDCGNNKTGRKNRAEQLVECELKAVPCPVEFRERPLEEQQIFVDKINNAIEGGKISELLKIAEILKRDPMWVYWKFSEERLTINVPLLHEIAKIKEYKPGWQHFKYEEIEKKLRRRRK